MRESLIAQNVSRSYAGKQVLSSASLTLEPGKVTALLGQSGAGKSTLLRLFAGLERPDTGTIHLGQTVFSSDTEMLPAEKRRVGLIFQDFALFPHLTAQQNVAFGLNKMPKTEALSHAAAWLDRLGLIQRAAAYPHQLSGGEKQRVAIARALAPEPVAILMDEPFSGLDPALRADVRASALEAVRASNTPALVVTHDASEAMLSADHLAVMSHGEILQQDTPEIIYSQPCSIDVATALGPIIIVIGTPSDIPNTLNTAFGPVSMLLTATTSDVQLGIRPEGILIDPTSARRASVLARHRNGPMIQLSIIAEGQSAEILVPHDAQTQEGDDIGIRIDPQSCTIFA